MNDNDKTKHRLDELKRDSNNHELKQSIEQKQKYINNPLKTIKK